MSYRHVPMRVFARPQELLSPSASAGGFCGNDTSIVRDGVVGGTISGGTVDTAAGPEMLASGGWTERMGEMMPPGEDAAWQALLTVLRAWPTAFRAELIEVAIPEAAGDESTTTAANAAGRSRWFAVVPPPPSPPNQCAMQTCLLELIRRPAAVAVGLYCIGAGGLDLLPDVTNFLFSSLDCHLRSVFPGRLEQSSQDDAETNSSSAAGSTVAPYWVVVETGPCRCRHLIEWLASEAFIFGEFENGSAYAVDVNSVASSTATKTSARALSNSGGNGSGGGIVGELPAASLWPLLCVPQSPLRMTRGSGMSAGQTVDGARGKWELRPGGMVACTAVLGQLLRDRYEAGFRAGHLVRRFGGGYSVSLVCAVPASAKELHGAPGTAAKLGCSGQLTAFGASEAVEQRSDPPQNISSVLLQYRVCLNCSDGCSVRVALFAEPTSARILTGRIPNQQFRTLLSKEIALLSKECEMPEEMQFLEFFEAATTALRESDKKLASRIAAYEELLRHCTDRASGSHTTETAEGCCVQQLISDLRPLVLSFEPMPSELLRVPAEPSSAIAAGSGPPGTEIFGDVIVDPDQVLWEVFAEEASRGFGTERHLGPNSGLYGWRCFAKLYSEGILLLLLPQRSSTAIRTDSNPARQNHLQDLWEWHSQEEHATSLVGVENDASSAVGRKSPESDGGICKQVTSPCLSQQPLRLSSFDPPPPLQVIARPAGDKLPSLFSFLILINLFYFQFQ